jgi:hypothetical protein
LQEFSFPSESAVLADTTVVDTSRTRRICSRTSRHDYASCPNLHFLGDVAVALTGFTCDLGHSKKKKGLYVPRELLLENPGLSRALSKGAGALCRSCQSHSAPNCRFLHWNDEPLDTEGNTVFNIVQREMGVAESLFGSEDTDSESGFEEY